MMNYLGALSMEIWDWFGKSSRLLLQDFNRCDSEQMTEESMGEAKGEEMYWFIDTCVVRKLSD